MVPVRAAPVLAATVNVTEPVPLPAGDVTVIQEALLAGPQLQLLCALTAIVPDPPAAGMF
jgi:hypothetical protein